MAELATELGHSPEFYLQVADEIAAKIGESPETVLKGAQGRREAWRAAQGRQGIPTEG